MHFNGSSHLKFITPDPRVDTDLLSFVPRVPFNRESFLSLVGLQVDEPAWDLRSYSRL